jgi:aspartate racemase
MTKTPHIGIVGVSAEGAALCYKTICLEGDRHGLGAYDHPDVTMHTHSLGKYMACIYRNDWSGVAALMLSSANVLARAGATFLICPDNTVHQVFAEVEAASPLPWIHIADVVGDEAARRGFRKLALTGTKYLVQSDVYPSRLAPRGIEVERPAADEREEINRIIFDELQYAVLKPEAVASFQRAITRMKNDGCDAVVLGCTEIPLLMNDGNSPLPTLDSTRLLARAALRAAVTSSVTPI